MARYCGGVTNEELCEAIRLASFRKRNPKLGKPELREARMWVFAYRKELLCGTVTQDSGEGCAMCSKTGILAVAPELPDDGWTFAWYMQSYTTTVPCVCGKGEYTMEHCKPWCDVDSGQLRALRDKGARQFEWAEKNGWAEG